MQKDNFLQPTKITLKITMYYYVTILHSNSSIKASIWCRWARWDRRSI